MYRPRSHSSRITVLVVIALAAAAGGCGYKLGYRAPDDVRSIAVPIFDNATFPLRRGVEYDLTDSVRTEIQTRTDLRLVDQDRADLVLYGRVLRFQERVIAEGRRDEKLESNIHVLVELRVEDYVHGTTWTKTVSDVEPFSVARGETLDVARGRAIDNLAEKILIAVEAW